MFASLLPGLRELRAPLAAGYLWLLVVYFIAGTPTKVDEAPGPLQDLLTVLPSLGTAATGIAVSFVAYLVGSVSQDAFAQLFSPGLARLSRRGLRSGHDLTELRLHSLIKALENWRDDLNQSRQPNEDFEESRGYAVSNLDAINRTLLEMSAAGASETEKPEALRPMVEAEENLRVAILPPFLALMVTLTITESPVWLLGLLFASALLGQATARRAEARRLAAQAYRAREMIEVMDDLRSVARSIDAGEFGVEKDKLLTASLHRLRNSGGNNDSHLASRGSATNETT